MLKAFSFLIAIGLMTLSNGCKEADAPKIIETTPASQARYFKEYAGPHENLKLIRDNLYQDETGELYFDASNGEERHIYLKYEGRPDSDYQTPTYLTNIIDRDNWHHIFDSFYSDKTSLFCNHIMADGGFIGRVRGVKPHSISIILTDFDKNTFRKVAVNKFERSAMAKNERAWQITDGETVVGVRCRNHGPLSEWTAEMASK
jgi:hypothetical protein